MEIIVCVKQVPDTTEVKIDPITNTLIRQGVPSIVNPFDRNAVEAALQLKDKHGGKVTVITMGPPQAKDALKACLAMGADAALLISDRAFGGADTLATSYTLAAAIRKLGKYDVIFCGKQAIDGDTAQVGPETAEHLDIAQVTYVAKMEIDGDTARVEREHEEGYEIIDVKLPVMISVIKSATYEPRLASIKATMKANRTEIPTWTAADVNADEKKIGLQGSPTKVSKIFSPPRRTQGIVIQGDTARESVMELIQKLSDAKIV
ncbi:MAG: carD 2 [Firmicutes bacterium]|nr:carD 2 [Bacillota bacterium]